MTRVKIAPSLLAADFARLSDAMAAVREGGADLIHVDVMDGRFVPNLTFGPPMVEALRRATDLPLDIHLMIERPEETLPRYLCGVQYVSVHVEATAHLHRCLEMIRRGGASAGAALNPATAVGALEAAIPHCDHVLVMSVNPGAGGQSFIETSFEKIAAVKTLMGPRRRPVEVDGGVDPDNAARCAASGADILVSGSAIYGSEDPALAVRRLRAAAETRSA